MHDYAAILKTILKGYALPLGGDHGVVHWARVYENGLKVAEQSGADTEVVKLFALFHDSRRINEYYDEGHGQRGGELALLLRGTLIHLDDDRFDLLYEACRLHTDGLTEGDVTLRTCWDADRLDLGRVGTTPVAHLLCTEPGRKLIRWADGRAVSNHRPIDVLNQWRIDLPH